MTFSGKMDATLSGRMDATFRRTMTNLTDVLFPVKKDVRDPQRVQLLKTGTYIFFCLLTTIGELF